mmetsp:Transcript_5457/g.16255  ORF Transcript_5457/g.16255 Transcript_5457/m.16255 type:complete len:234 (+) Transcript_5457:1177-1878(+)
MLEHNSVTEAHSCRPIVDCHREVLVHTLRPVGTPRAIDEGDTVFVHYRHAVHVVALRVEGKSGRVGSVASLNLSKHRVGFLPRVSAEERPSRLAVHPVAEKLIDGSDAPIELARRQHRARASRAKVSHAVVRHGRHLVVRLALSAQIGLHALKGPWLPCEECLSHRNVKRFFVLVVHRHLRPVDEVERIAEHRREAVTNVVRGRVKTTGLGASGELLSGGLHQVVELRLERLS